MTSSRAVRSIVTLTASVALLATAPAGIALAHDNDSNSRCSTSRGHHHDTLLDCLTDAQTAAVKAARAAYRSTAEAIMKDLKSELKPAKERFRADIAAERAAKDAARDAYVAAVNADADAATQADLKAKYEAARAAYVAAAKQAYGKYQARVTEASASARIDLARAVLVYAKAINATFAPDAAPSSLLKVPGGRLDYDAYGPGWFGYHPGWGNEDSGHDGDGHR